MMPTLTRVDLGEWARYEALNEYARDAYAEHTRQVLANERTCPDCGLVAPNNAGLAVHRRFDCEVAA